MAGMRPLQEELAAEAVIKPAVATKIRVQIRIATTGSTGQRGALTTSPPPNKR